MSSPSPTPTSSLLPVGLTQLSEFPTLGFMYRYPERFNGRGSRPAAPDPSELISIRYFAAASTYEMQAPDFAWDRLVVVEQLARWPWTTLRLSSTQNRQLRIDLYKPGNFNGELALDYTSQGRICGLLAATNGDTLVSTGMFAYGVPTARGDMPSKGVGRYSTVVGQLRDTGAASNERCEVDFGVNFATGGVAGTFHPVWTDAWFTWKAGDYPLTEVVFAPGASSFSGRFDIPGRGIDGFFEGQFTGPQAAELMVRWQVPVRDPYSEDVNPQWFNLFGVWVGKRMPFDSGI